MKKIFLALIFVGSILQSNAQTVDFEDVVLDSGKVLNGFDGETEYVFTYNTSDLHLPTFWDTSFGGFWASGWAISRKYDSATVSTNFDRHLYCVKAYKGAGGSNTFVIGQNGASLYRDHSSFEGITFLNITNTTAAYNSMALGDVLAKKFGGSSGNDSDYFFCRIKSYHMGVVTDSQDIYLADFRFSNNQEDYILKDWKDVHFSWTTDSLTFDLYSSDTGQYGINTPAFFAIDNVGYTPFENTQNISKPAVKLYPNPATDLIQVNSDVAFHAITIFNASGNLVWTFQGQASETQMDVSGWMSGVYYGQIQSEAGLAQIRFVVAH